MDARMKPSPAQDSPTTKSPFRGMPNRSSGFRNRSPSMLGADAEAADGDTNGFTAVEFKGEWEDELERRSQRRRESESLTEEGESPLGSDRFAAPPIPPPRSPRRQSVSPPSPAAPVPPPRRQNSTEQQQQTTTTAQLLEAAVQRAAEVGAADFEALEEAEAHEKTPTPPPRRRSPRGGVGSAEGDVSPLDKGVPSASPQQEGEPPPNSGRSFAGTKWVAKPGGPQRRPLHPLRPPPPPEEEEEEEPPPPDPLAIAMNNSMVLNNFMRTAVEGAKTLAKETISPKGRYAGDGGGERDNIFRQKERFEAGLKKEAEGKLRAVLPNLMQRTTDAESAAKLRVQIEAAKAAGVAGPVVAMAEHKLNAFFVGEENREYKQAARLRKESEKAELASPEGVARKVAEEQLRAVYPFPSMAADPARLKPAIEAAKQAGVAAPIVAMAMVKLKEAEDSPTRSLSLVASSQIKASSALENTANALQNFQDGVANWSMPSWDEGVTITVGDTTVRGRGLSLLAMPVAVMGLVVKRRSRLAIEEAEGSLRRSRIVRAWDAERREWTRSDTASVGSSDDEKPPSSPYLLCVRGGKHLDSARASAEDRATAAGRSASPPPPPHPHPPTPTPPPHPTPPHIIAPSRPPRAPLALALTPRPQPSPPPSPPPTPPGRLRSRARASSAPTLSSGYCQRRRPVEARPRPPHPRHQRHASAFLPSRRAGPPPPMSSAQS